MTTRIMKRLILGATLSIAFAATAQDSHRHDHATSANPANPQAISPDRSDNLDHAIHEPVAPSGDWSYLQRANPEPSTTNRWEMIPVTGETHAFRFAGTVEGKTVCARLDERRVMVDRATRAACEADAAASPFAGMAGAAAPQTDPGQDEPGQHH